MAHVFINRCHDAENQGARIACTEYSEYMLSEHVALACRDTINEQSKHRAYVYHGKLGTRIKRINEACASFRQPIVAVECHWNWFDDPKRDGYFVMAHHGSLVGQNLARCVLEQMSQVLTHSRNMGINYVSDRRQWINTRHEYPTDRQRFVCQTGCPAILIEAGFLSCPSDAEWIKLECHRTILGRAIGRGIVNHLHQQNGE